MARLSRLSISRLLDHPRTVTAVAIGAVVVLGLVAGLLRLLPIGSRPTDGVPRIVFAAFGRTSDILYVAPATNPDEREVIGKIEHAQDWGINPTMRGDLIAYVAMPPGSAATATTPAELWVLNASTQDRTRLARDADVYIQPRFAPDGKSILYRRSAGDTQAILSVDLASQARTVLHEGRGITPLGHDAAGSLVYSQLSSAGTDVYTKRGADAPRLAFHASDEPVQGLQISPDAESVAFLAMELRAERIVSRAIVMRLDSGQRVPLPDTNPLAEQYGPAWTRDGANISVGQQPPPGAGAPVVLLQPGEVSNALPAPAKGFDVPFAWSDGGTYLLARTLDGESAHNAGRESAVVIATNGQRYPVSTPGEVILVGWLPNA